VRAIRDCTTQLVLCSPAAMGSANVRQELQLAWDQGRPCLPLVLEQTTYPDEVQYLLAGRHWIELLDWPEPEWLPEVLLALGRLGLATASGNGEPPMQESEAATDSRAAADVHPSRRGLNDRLAIGIGAAVLLLSGLLAVGVAASRHGRAVRAAPGISGSPKITHSHALRLRGHGRGRPCQWRSGTRPVLVS
jgi:hypothetical protein